MAIIYSYPTVTPESGDLIVGTDITGKVTKNFTVGSIVSTEIPTYITGTTNTVPLFTGANTIGNSIITQTAAGDVGIGTTTPSSKLDVSGNIAATNLTVTGDVTGDKFISSSNSARFVEPSATSQLNNLRVDSTLGSTLSSGVYGWQLEYDTTHASSVTFRFDNDNYSIYSGAGFGEIARFTDTGNVGIGTTTVNAKLNVDGSVKIDGTNPLWFGGSGSIPTWQINASGNDLVIDDVGGNSGDLIFSGQQVGIGTTTPSSKLEVDGGDIEIDDSASGLILRSPDGTRYRVTVANGGTLSVSAV